MKFVMGIGALALVLGIIALVVLVILPHALRVVRSATSEQSTSRRPGFSYLTLIVIAVMAGIIVALAANQ